MGHSRKVMKNVFQGLEVWFPRVCTKLSTDADGMLDVRPGLSGIKDASEYLRILQALGIFQVKGFVSWGGGGLGSSEMFFRDERRTHRGAALHPVMHKTFSDVHHLIQLNGACLAVVFHLDSKDES